MAQGAGIQGVRTTGTGAGGSDSTIAAMGTGVGFDLGCRGRDRRRGKWDNHRLRREGHDRWFGGRRRRRFRRRGAHDNLGGRRNNGRYRGCDGLRSRHRSARLGSWRRPSARHGFDGRRDDAGHAEVAKRGDRLQARFRIDPQRLIDRAPQIVGIANAGFLRRRVLEALAAVSCRRRRAPRHQPIGERADGIDVRGGAQLRLTVIEFRRPCWICIGPWPGGAHAAPVIDVAEARKHRHPEAAVGRVGRGGFPQVSGRHKSR